MLFVEEVTAHIQFQFVILRFLDILLIHGFRHINKSNKNIYILYAQPCQFL